MKRLKSIKKRLSKLQILVLVIILFFSWTLWPIKGLLLPQHWWGQSLVIFMNENEARPCGGFATVFGVANLPLLDLELKNVYHFDKLQLGESAPALRGVAAQKKFWDLGDTPDLQFCSKKFEEAYRKGTSREVDRVILVNFGLLESWVNILGSVKIQAESIPAHKFFSTLSRLVADVDRHDEVSLETRKSPLVGIGKNLLWKTLLSPHKWPRITRLIHEENNRAELFITSQNQEISPTENDFSILEWNLGGGKSSRYLEKTFALNFRETNPHLWSITLSFTAQHFGGQDEPLSQAWKGIFEIQSPLFLEAKNEFIPAEIAPGETFTITKNYEYTGSLQELSFFKPRGQELNVDLLVSLFPQQTLQSKDLNTQENTGRFHGTLADPQTSFTWNALADHTAPFLTLHEAIDGSTLHEEIKNILDWAPNDITAEVHFNEPIGFIADQNLSISLQDRNYTHTEIQENPTLKKYHLMPDQTTLLLNFQQTNPQTNERFYLEIFGVEDLWGNRAEVKNRTIIVR